jgi:hypothetical protein
MAENTPNIYATLNKEDQQAVDSFKELQATLFPDGKIPAVEEIRKKIVSGNYTVRDAFIARMYDQGVPEQSLFSQLDETKDFYKKFEKAFTKKVVGPAIGVVSIVNNLKSTTNKNIDLNTPFEELKKIALDPESGITESFRSSVTRPLVTSSGNVEQLKLASRGVLRDSQKLAEGAIPPEVLKYVLSGIADIPDEVTRDAVLTSLIGYRGTDLSGIRISRELAVRAGVPRPYYDREAGIVKNPDVRTGRGRKGAGPDRPPGPVLREILNRRFDNAGPTGELFPDIETATITKALKKYVFPKIPKEVTDKLRKDPSGYTDLRRITASAIANQLGRPDLASQIISHDKSGYKVSDNMVLDKVMTGYYIDVEDLSGLEQRGQVLAAYEKMMADALGATDAKGLAEELNLNLSPEFNADYDDVDVTTPSSAPSPTREATPEEIAQGEQLRQAKTNLQVEQARLQSATAGQQADETILVRAEKAAEVAAAEQKLRETKAEAKVASKVKRGASSVASMIAEFGTKAGKALLPLAMFEGARMGYEATTGMPAPIRALGATAGAAAEVIAPPGMAPTDVEFRQSQRATRPSGAGLGPRTDIADQMSALGYIRPEQAQYPMEAAPVSIPDAAPVRPPALSAGNAKERVNLATRAAEQGKETPMGGSFLNLP